MDKKWILLLLVAGVAGYFIWKKKKSKPEETAEDKFKPGEKDFQAAEEYEEIEVQTGLTAKERETMTPEEIAEAEEKREQQLKLDLLRREYKDLTGQNLKAYTVEAAELELNDAKKKIELLREYVTLTNDQNANINDERYDTVTEIEALIGAANKAAEYVNLGGTYEETRGKTAQQIEELINAKKEALKSKWNGDRSYIEGIKNNFNTYLIKDITYKNKEANIKPIKDFLTKCTDRDRAFFVASINNGGNVKIKYDSKQYTYKTLATAIQKMFDNKSFGTHKNAGAFLQSVLQYAKEYDTVKITDFDIYGRRIK